MYIHIYLHVSYHYRHIKFTRVNYSFHIYTDLITQSRILSNWPQLFFLLHTCQAKFIFRDIFHYSWKPRLQHFIVQENSPQKNFEIDGIGFGWKAIEDQYNRDRLRAGHGCAPRAPGLRYNFVYRDVWTRLNVLAAKIMQVYITMSKLFKCDGQDMNNVL